LFVIIINEICRDEIWNITPGTTGPYRKEVAREHSEERAGKMNVNHRLQVQLEKNRSSTTRQS